jgi:hypothetical protein
VNKIERQKRYKNGEKDTERNREEREINKEKILREIENRDREKLDKRYRDN